MTFLANEEINVLLYDIVVCCYPCVHKYWLSTSNRIRTLNDDEIKLRIKRDLPVS